MLEKHGSFISGKENMYDNYTTQTLISINVQISIGLNAINLLLGSR